MVLVGILFPLPFAFSFLTAAFWYNAEGKASLAATMQLAGGSFIFVTDILGWYLFLALMLAAIDSPVQLPGELERFNGPYHLLILHVVGDLSHRIKGASERSNAKENTNKEEA
jgi:hypothetical protein